MKNTQWDTPQNRDRIIKNINRYKKDIDDMIKLIK
jgi:hypothetical protein